MPKQPQIILLTCLLIFLSATVCSPKYGANKNSNCNGTLFNPAKNDTTAILYEALAQTIQANIVPDFSLIRDKNQLYVLNTYFIPRCSNQDITDYQKYKKIEALPGKIGSTSFCLLSNEEIQKIAESQEQLLYALQIGYITIKGDTAITGMMTYPVKPKQDKSVIMSGGGMHMKFHKSSGKWIFSGPAFCQWISWN